MFIFTRFSSPFENLSGVILDASIPVFTENKIIMSKIKNSKIIKRNIIETVNNAGKIYEHKNATMLPNSK